MSVAVDVAADGVRVPLSLARVAAIARAVLRAERVRHALLSLAFVPAPAMTRLNARHLGRRRATDVIAFGFTRAAVADPVIGDIYICPSVAAGHARRLGVGVREEIARLVVHGTLHVLGYDHPDDDSRLTSPMWRRQETLVRRALAASA